MPMFPGIGSSGASLYGNQLANEEKRTGIMQSQLDDQRKARRDQTAMQLAAMIFGGLGSAGSMGQGMMGNLMGGMGKGGGLGGF